LSVHILEKERRGGYLKCPSLDLFSRWAKNR